MLQVDDSTLIAIISRVERVNQMKHRPMIVRWLGLFRVAIHVLVSKAPVSAARNDCCSKKQLLAP
jgi:hypothetical protein